MLPALLGIKGLIKLLSQKTVKNMTPNFKRSLIVQFYNVILVSEKNDQSKYMYMYIKIASKQYVVFSCRILEVMSKCRCMLHPLI